MELLATVALPHEGRIVLFADGRPVTESDGPELRHQADEPGVYRIEVHTADAPGTPPIPWIVSNPIYVGASRTAASASISRASTSTAALVEGGEGTMESTGLSRGTSGAVARLRPLLETSHSATNSDHRQPRICSRPPFAHSTPMT